MMKRGHGQTNQLRDINCALDHASHVGMSLLCTMLCLHAHMYIYSHAYVPVVQPHL